MRPDVSRVNLSSFVGCIAYVDDVLAPILGDDWYSDTKPSSDITKLTMVPEGRMYLHAYEMSFFVSFGVSCSCACSLTW